MVKFKNNDHLIFCEIIFQQIDREQCSVRYMGHHEQFR